MARIFLSRRIQHKGVSPTFLSPFLPLLPALQSNAFPGCSGLASVVGADVVDSSTWASCFRVFPILQGRIPAKTQRQPGW
jgi:hypothetical protein